MVYGPLAVVRTFLTTSPVFASDASFSAWHHEAVGQLASDPLGSGKP
jgi:hypothetical protein